jgi:hypothetical protein
LGYETVNKQLTQFKASTKNLDKINICKEHKTVQTGKDVRSASSVPMVLSQE